MRVVCCGTGGFHDTELSRTACYFMPELGVVFDLGSGFFRTSNLLKTDYLDIFLSHGHLDHISGLPTLLETHDSHSIKRIKIHAEDKVLTAVRALWADPYFIEEVPVQYIPFGSGPISCECGAIVTTFPLKHTSTCFGFRLEYDDRSLAYVTDTSSYSDSPYVKSVRGVDVLLHECYCEAGVDATKYGHTSADRLAEFAKAAAVSRVITIHHNPSVCREMCLASLQKEIPTAIAANDGDIFTI